MNLEDIVDDFRDTFFMGDAKKARRTILKNLRQHFEDQYLQVQKGRLPDLREICACGHDRHHRMILTDCAGCGCQLFRPR